MNTLGLGRYVETLGLGVPYSGGIIVSGYKEIIKFTLYLYKKIGFTVER